MQPSSTIKAADEQIATQPSSALQAADERMVKLLTMMQSKTPPYIETSSDPIVSSKWESVLSDVGANLLENPFGAVSPEIMVAGVLSWL